MAYKESVLANAIGADRRLTVKLEEARSQFDYILIDCPPSLGICTTCSLVASNYCIVSIQPEASAYYGVENLFNRIAEVRTYINPALNVKGIVFTMVHKNQIRRLANGELTKPVRAKLIKKINEFLDSKRSKGQIVPSRKTHVHNKRRD